MASPERISRSRTKGVSQSQPSSRSGSPTSRLSYATYSHTDGTGRVRRKSGIPTPLGTSREASPTRPTAATPSMTGSCFKCGEEGHMSRHSSHFKAACCGNLKDKTKTDSTMSKDQAANVGADQGW